jgi:hypothetical protein
MVKMAVTLKERTVVADKDSPGAEKKEAGTSVSKMLGLRNLSVSIKPFL